MHKGSSVPVFAVIGIPNEGHSEYDDVAVNTLLFTRISLMAENVEGFLK